MFPLEGPQTGTKTIGREATVASARSRQVKEASIDWETWIQPCLFSCWQDQCLFLSSPPVFCFTRRPHPFHWLEPASQSHWHLSNSNRVLFTVLWSVCRWNWLPQSNNMIDFVEDSETLRVLTQRLATSEKDFDFDSRRLLLEAKLNEKRHASAILDLFITRNRMTKIYRSSANALFSYLLFCF